MSKLSVLLSGAALVACTGQSPAAHVRDAAATIDAASDAARRDPQQPPTAESSAASSGSTVAGLKVALLGDQGVGDEAQKVLMLIKNEHADAVIHLGDFSYGEASPSGWDDQINAVLGSEFPYFAVIGNHDTAAWPGTKGFAAVLSSRLARISEAQCEGEYGVKASCTFRGLAFVLSGVGTYGDGHEAFLESALSKSDAAFKLCIWHKNQHDMQVGSKSDEVGWDAYRICAKYGVPVVTGHEHSYARTRLLAAIGDKEHGHGAQPEANLLVLQPGRTFVSVAGLGGESARARTADHVSDTWWASIYARDYQLQNGVERGTDSVILYGALFLEFNVEGHPYQARGYFKTVDGEVHDEFAWTVPSDR